MTVLNNLIIPSNQLLTVFVEDYPFVISVTHIQDVVATPHMTKVPLVPSLVIGLMNLRGRIVTALDMGVKLGLRPTCDVENSMSVILENQGELYSLVVDRIGDVVEANLSHFKKTPPNIDSRWGEICTGVFNYNDILHVSLLEDKLCEV